MVDRNYSTGTRTPLEQALILVVEDELILAEDMRGNLIALGYRVPEAVVSGEEAIRQAEEMRPDLVLMDIKLQGEVDGIQAAERIQRLDIPVIFITAFSDDVTLQRSKIAGPFGYIIKPVETRELHVAVEIALYRHQLETRLKENERWLDTTLRSIGDGVIATDAVGRVTFMNPVAEELTGWKQADAVGHDLTEVFHIVNEVTKEPVENPVTRVLQEGAIVGLANHTLLIRKDGSEIPIDDSGAPIRDDNGIITGVVLVFRDVTERVRAEVVRRQAEGALKTAKEFAENLVETANTIIVTLDSEANITTFNRYAEQLTGYKKAEVIGRNWFDIFISQRDRENIPKVFSQALKNMPQASQYENSIVTKNGEERLISWSNNILRDSSGNITGVLSIGMDITERKQAEEERLAHLNFLQAMEQVTRAIQQTSDLEQVMKDVLETVLSIFQCDRAWLLYPCDPDAPSWRVPMECTRPEYPGALNMNVDYAMTSDVARDFQRLLDSEEPLTFAWNPGDAEFDPKDEFAIQSAIGMAIYPRTGQPWEFGLHQCSRTRTWTEREKRLFKGIGHRIADALSSLLFFQNLQRSEERYRTIFETAGVSIWEEDFSAIHAACKELQVQGVTDLRRYLDEHPEFVRQAAQMIKVVDVNETTVKMFGAASKADLLTSLDRIVVPETMDIFREEILAIAEGRTYFVGETVNQTLDGNRLNVLLTMRIPMEEEKLDRVLVSLTDITERKRMEEALRESEARYRLHFENVSDIIYSLDSEFRILDVSPSVERVLGYKPEELIGKSFQELNVLASEYLGQAFSDTMCVLAGERITSAVYQFIAQDGTKRWGEVSGAPLVRDGQVVALVSVARDITERKRIEKQLHQHERLAAVGQLAAGIAHDFRNMLTTIILYANMGLHKPDLPPNLAQNL